MNATPEEWRWVPGYEGRYEVSNCGRVRSWVAKGLPHPYVLTAWSGQMGRLSTHLSIGGRKRNRLVHQLVMEAFVGPCPPGMLVRHLNGHAYDNRLENLAYGTPLENAADAKRHGTVRSPISERTHCKRGHELSGENIYRRGEGGRLRVCKACMKMHQKAHYERKKAARASAQVSQGSES